MSLFPDRVGLLPWLEVGGGGGGGEGNVHLVDMVLEVNVGGFGFGFGAGVDGAADMVSNVSKRPTIWTTYLRSRVELIAVSKRGSMYVQ